MVPQRRVINFELLVMVFAVICFTCQVGLIQIRGPPKVLMDDEKNPLLFSVQERDWIGRRSLNSLSMLDYSDYPDEPKLVIVTYVSNHQSDVDKLCILLKSLDTYVKGDIKGYPTPVLVFNDGTLSNYQLEMIVWSTSKPIAFPSADLGYPEEFNLSEESEEIQERLKSIYPQVVRFWLTGLWKHPGLDAFDIVMRVDFDTCFNQKNNYLPNFEKHRMSYHAQYVGFDDSNTIIGLHDFAKEYLAKENILPSDPLAWQLMTQSWVKKQSLPLYQASIEVIRKSFMQHPQVTKFNEAVTEKEPFGVFRHGWNDHAVRFLTTTLFTNNEHHLLSGFQGFQNRASCAKVESKEDKRDLQDLFQFEVIEIKNNVFEEPAEEPAKEPVKGSDINNPKKDQTNSTEKK